MATFGKNGTVQEVFTFSAADFLVENTDLELDSIVLTALPDANAGILTMGNVGAGGGRRGGYERRGRPALHPAGQPPPRPPRPSPSPPCSPTAPPGRTRR